MKQFMCRNDIIEDMSTVKLLDEKINYISRCQNDIIAIKNEYNKLLNYFKIPHLNLKDYEDITSYFSADYVSYKDTIAKMREIATGSLFIE